MSFLTDHLDEVGETYFKHMGRALWFSVSMIVGGIACLVHALLPFLFVRTASGRIQSLHESMTGRRGAGSFGGDSEPDDAASTAKSAASRA